MGGFLYGKMKGVLVVLFFTLSLKSIMVSFRVPNFHNLIERLENLSNFISKCSNLFDSFFHAHRHLSDSLTLFLVILPLFCI